MEREKEGQTAHVLTTAESRRKGGPVSTAQSFDCSVDLDMLWTRTSEGHEHPKDSNGLWT